MVPADEPVSAAAAREAAEPDTFRRPRAPRSLVDPFRASGSVVSEPDASPFGRRVVAAMIRRPPLSNCSWHPSARAQGFIFWVFAASAACQLMGFVSSSIIFPTP